MTIFVVNYGSYNCLLRMLYVLELGTVNFVGGGGGGGYSYYVHILVSQIVLFIIGLLTIGYVSHYTIVAYDICVMISVGR